MDEQKPDRLRGVWHRGIRLAERSLDVFYTPGQEWFSRLLTILFIAGLFVYGIRLWGIFFSWGNISFDFLDWAEVTGPRYALLSDAAMKGQLPLHAANLTALRGVTDRYFSIADTPFSPQYLLLPLMETGRYIFLDTLLLYTTGFVGLLLIYRKYRLSPVSFLFLFLLFFFNGNITSHLAVGHSNFAGQFLLPYFVLLVLSLIENQGAGWKWYLGLAGLMLVMLLQGAFHPFVWCIIFLAVIALFNWRLIKPVVLGGLFSILVCLPRLLPPSLALEGITQEYKGGFASATDLVQGLISLQDPFRAVRQATDTFPLNAWEIDFFIGLLGLAFLVVFGILLPLLRDRSKKSLQVQVLVPCLVLAALSIGQVYARIISFLRIPPFTGERVTSRILILPLVFVLVLAVIFFQREINRHRLPSWGQILILGLGYLVFHDLHQHMQAWRIRYLDSMVTLFPKVPFEPMQHTIQNHPDPIYTAMLSGGLIVAILSLIFLAYMAFLKKTDA